MTSYLKTWLRAHLWPIGGLLASVALFLFYPKIDLHVAGWFFNGERFPLDSHPVVQFVYLAFAKVHFVFVLGLPVLAARAHFRRNRDPGARDRRLIYAFLWLTLIVGPGLITHVWLKDNSFGRPRPRDVVEFQGSKHYAEPFEVSAECPRNCSFVSGHAAIGFWFITFGWVYGRRRWLLPALALGLIVSATRVTQGAHFLSDVVFSFWVVWFTNALLASWFGLPHHPWGSEPQATVDLEDPA